MDVRLPDGTVVRNVPEGTTKAQLAAKLKSSGMDVPREWMGAPSSSSVAINAANKAIAGVPDAILNTPTNLLNLGKAGFGSLAIAAGRPDLAPELTQNPDFISGVFRRGGFIRDDAEPMTAGQRLLDSTVQGAVGGAMNPSGAIPQTAAMMSIGGMSGLIGSGTREVTGNDALGISASLLTPLAANAAKNAATARIADLAAQQSRNAPRDEALKAGLDAGMKLPPATAKPTLFNRTAESIGGKAATAQDASINNVEKINALARRSIGLADDAPLTEETTRAVRRDAFNAGYRPVEQVGTISAGAAYRKELDDIVGKYRGASRSFPGAVRDDVTTMVDGLRQRRFDAGDAIKMTQTLRDDASRSFSNGDAAMGNAQRAAAAAIENQIERSLPGIRGAPPSLMDNFRNARMLMARTHTVEDAIRSGTGNVDANRIAAEFQSGAPLTGELKTIGAFANNFKKAVQPPQNVGSPGVSKAAAMASMFMGGGGAAVGGPAGAAFGAVPLLAPPLVRGAMMSDRYQRGLMPDYSPGLLTSGAAALPDAPNLMPALLFSEELKRQREKR